MWANVKFRSWDPGSAEMDWSGVGLACHHPNLSASCGPGLAIIPVCVHFRDMRLGHWNRYDLVLRETRMVLPSAKPIAHMSSEVPEI